MKNILVTGGAGYIGSNLIDSLIDKYKDCHIVSLDCYLSGSVNNHLNSKRVKYINGKTWDINLIFKKNNFDIIYHFGEYSRIVHSFADIDFVSKSIVSGTLEVLKFAIKNNSKLIYSASSSKFGNDGNDENLSPYAFFKSKNIELIKNYKKWFGLNYEICYFFNVYGKNHISTGKYATVIAIFENQYKNNQNLTVVSPGNQSRNFTHIDDVIDGVIKVSEQTSNGEFYLGYYKNFEIMDVALRFQKEIKILDTRLGERFKSEIFESDTNRLLDWKANIDLFEYIDDFKSSIKKNY